MISALPVPFCRVPMLVPCESSRLSCPTQQCVAYYKQTVMLKRGGTDEPCPGRVVLAAAVVLFNPDPEALQRLVETVLGSAGRLYVFLNSAIPLATRRALTADKRIRLLGFGVNQGIGAALNTIVSAARRECCERLFLFDQDSRPTAAMMDRVCAAAVDLERAGKAPAVVAPRLVVPRNSCAGKAPSYQPWPAEAAVGNELPVAFVPTSGSLLMLDRIGSTGMFRADYFIDGIDLEWCFRAWSRGHGCWLAAGAEMEHPIGSGVIRWPLPPFTMPRQVPFRMHCHIRNALYGMRLAHVPTAWKLKQLAYLPFQILAFAVHHRFAPTVVALLGSGVADGIRGRLGVPRSAPGTGVDPILWRSPVHDRGGASLLLCNRRNA